MPYLIILGRESALAAAEIVATGAFARLAPLGGQAEVLWVEASRPLADPQGFLDRLGGTIKIAEVVSELPKPISEILSSDLVPLIPIGGGKVSVGISVYADPLTGAGKSVAIDRLGYQLKKNLAAAKRSARFVSSRTNPLSSVIVRTQKLLGSKGCELILIPTARGVVIGRTVAAQNFIDYGRRDAGRPNRDIHRGMLPPKVAQILLNLARLRRGATVLDPFCGVGTVLQEALLGGAGRAIGRDSDSRAIADTEANLRWLSQRYRPLGNWEAYVHDARRIDHRLDTGCIDAVVTEPYLGPLRPPRAPAAQHQLMVSLVELYRASLDQLVRVVKPGGRLALVVPVIGSRSAAELVGELGGARRVALLPEPLAGAFRINDSRTLLYQRPGQTVGRAVVVWEKG